jgi:hypothetical protein
MIFVQMLRLCDISKSEPLESRFHARGTFCLINWIATRMYKGDLIQHVYVYQYRINVWALALFDQQTSFNRFKILPLLYQFDQVFSPFERDNSLRPRHPSIWPDRATNYSRTPLWTAEWRQHLHLEANITPLGLIWLHPWRDSVVILGNCN